MDHTKERGAYAPPVMTTIPITIENLMSTSVPAGTEDYIEQIY